MVEEIERFLAERENGVYDRDNFDRYVAKRKLSLSCPVIHIAGSNGKGSTAFFLESIYRNAGYRVASFIKPYFYAVNECIRLNGKEISDDELKSLFRDNAKDFEKFHLSAFEATVALAYRFFEASKPDIAIIEAGMGGLIDATNIDDMDTRLSIITTVSLEHTSYLGTTLSQIALHKAGIIKPNSMVLVGKLDEASMEIIHEESEKLKAKLFRVEDYHFHHLVAGEFHFDYATYKDVYVPSIAEYQIQNACLAIEAVRLLSKDFPVEEEKIQAGLSEGSLPGRLERLGRIVLDGAHNPEAVKSLCRCVYSAGKGGPVHVLFASFRDKNIAVELPALANNCASITLTTFDHKRARDEMDYMLYVEDHPFVADPVEALKGLLEQYPLDTILITGSLNFVGFMRKAILEGGLATA